MDLIKFAEQNNLTKANISDLANRQGIEYKYQFRPGDGAITFLLLKNKHSTLVMHYDERVILAYFPNLHYDDKESHLADYNREHIYPHYIGTRITLYHYNNQWNICTQNAFLSNDLRWMNKTYHEIAQQLILNEYEQTLNIKYSYTFIIESHALNVFVDRERAILIDVRDGRQFVPDALAAHPLADKPITEIQSLTGQIDNLLDGRPHVFGYVYRHENHLTVYSSDLGRLINQILNNRRFAEIPQEKKEKYIITSIAFEVSPLALNVLNALSNSRHASTLNNIAARIKELEEIINRTTINMLKVYESRQEPIYRYICFFMNNYRRQLYSLLGSSEGEIMVRNFIKDTDHNNLLHFIEIL